MRKLMMFGVFMVVMSVLRPVLAVSVDSSGGWVSGYSAENTINGDYRNGDMGWAGANAWVIYDFGTLTSVSKVRITPPKYGGSGTSTFNPTAGTFEFSNDKTTWTSPIAWSAPQLESCLFVDYAESAMPATQTYRYARWTLTDGGRVGEVFFSASSQIACWEMNQNQLYSNSYPSFNSVDGDPGTLAVVGSSSGYGQPYVTYDLGVSVLVNGFTMQAGPWAQGNTPRAGQLWVSDNPASGFVKVGDWTTEMDWSNGEIRTFVLGDGVSGRYVQLRSSNGNTLGGQWSEFSVVPEPTILAILGLGGISVLFRRKRAG
jgi:hypothetical protein